MPTSERAAAGVNVLTSVAADVYVGEVTVRQDVKDLAALGPLPLEERVVGGEISQAQYSKWADLLERIDPPANDEEAALLVTLFPAEGSAFGIAWKLVRLIESAPHWPPADVLDGPAPSEWISMLRQRVENAKLRQSDESR